MKTILKSLSVGLLLLLCSCRPNGDERKNSIIAKWERARAYTKEYLDAAPESLFGFKPTPEMRTFGRQMLHLANGSYGLVDAAGEKSPYKFGELEILPLKTKEEISKVVLDSYDFVISTVKGMNSTRLESRVKIFKWEITVEEAIDKAFEHQTHHRGQTTVYFRLRGIVPPDEKLW